jgi:hypothetical protein
MRHGVPQATNSGNSFNYYEFGSTSDPPLTFTQQQRHPKQYISNE